MNRAARPPGGMPRPWLVYADGELFGDFRTKDAAVSTSHWDPDEWAGPGWTEPEPEAEQ